MRFECPDWAIDLGQGLERFVWTLAELEEVSDNG